MLGRILHQLTAHQRLGTNRDLPCHIPEYPGVRGIYLLGLLGRNYRCGYSEPTSACKTDTDDFWHLRLDSNCDTTGNARNLVGIASQISH